MSLKSIARRAVEIPAIGAPCASVLGTLGASERRARVLALCGYMPPRIKVRIPAYVRANSFFHLMRGKDVDQIAWRLWTGGWHGFEQPLPDLFALCAREAQAVLDVGANSGLYALIAASVSDQSQIHAFEPLPAALESLRRNISVNAFENRIKVVDAAVAETCSEAEFFVPSGNDGLLEMSASLNGTFRSQHSNVLRVPLVTLDQYGQEQRIPQVDLIKIDVESQEHRVLAGASRLLQQCRPIIFLEVLPQADMKAIDAIRQKFGYQTMAVRENGLAPLPAVSCDSDAVNQVLCPVERVSWLMKLRT